MKVTEIPKNAFIYKILTSVIIFITVFVIGMVIDNLLSNSQGSIFVYSFYFAGLLIMLFIVLSLDFILFKESNVFISNNSIVFEANEKLVTYQASTLEEIIIENHINKKIVVIFKFDGVALKFILSAKWYLKEINNEAFYTENLKEMDAFLKNKEIESSIVLIRDS